MDLGQMVQYGLSAIDRYTTWQYVMRWFGRSFSISFWKKLKKRGGQDFPPGSFQMDVDGALDVFISYRGSSGRYVLYLTLCGFYNVLPAFIFMFVICPAVVGFMNFISDPCRYTYSDDGEQSEYQSLPAGVGWLTYGNVCRVNAPARMWFVFRAYAAPFVIAMVLVWNPLMSWTKKTRVFLDKFCIQQSDMELCGAGVMRIPLFIQKSKVLHCLVDLELKKNLDEIFG